jgi:hypothetical protein
MNRQYRRSASIGDRIVEMIARRVVVLALVAALPARRAAADFPSVTTPDYAIDLYTGAALGSSRIVGMGGAAVATAEGSAGTLSNPAAPAVRAATSTASWDWDFHLDYLSSVRASDWDNNGEVSTDGTGVGSLTGGLSFVLGDWGLAAVVTQQTADFRVLDDDPATPELETHPAQASAVQGKVALARALFHEQLTAGLAIRFGTFEFRDQDRAVGDRGLFEIGGASAEAGALWRPWLGDLRVGGAIALPVTGKDVTINAECTQTDCFGYVLPERVEVPWQVTVGAAYRLAPTRWNQWVGGHWRDERSLTVALDVLVTGASPDAFGLEQFADHKLQRSGRDVVYSVRGGAEYEWLPGRLRVRAGSYWEPGRFLDGGGGEVGGRIHGTFGLEVRFLQFHLWGPRRGRVSMTGDLARHYTNVGISVGFWH